MHLHTKSKEVQIHTWEQVNPQWYSATLSHVTIIIHVAAKFSILGKRERILVVPCCSSQFCVVRYHNCPPFLVSMSVQKGAMILWDPLIGNGSGVYWVSGDSNVTSPLLFTLQCRNRFELTFLLIYTKASPLPPFLTLSGCQHMSENISTGAQNNLSVSQSIL